MFRNSILYRRFWYAKRRNTRRNYILLRIWSILLIVVIAVFCLERMVLPFLDDILQQKAAEKLNEAARYALCNKFPEGIRYDDFVENIRDDTGNTISLEINYARLNNLSMEISKDIDKRLEENKEQNVHIPLRNTSESIFSNSRELQALIIPSDKVQTEFDSHFYQEGSNQTRHIITLKVKASVDIKAYTISRHLQIVTNVPVAESIRK